MTDQEKAIHNLETRAREMTEHMGDIDFLVAHKDLFRALVLVRALNEDNTILDSIKDALRHGENALLVRVYAQGKLSEMNASLYATALCLSAISELEGQKEFEYLYEDVWALQVLISKHYTPVPYAPYTREQLIQGMNEDA